MVVDASEVVMTSSSAPGVSPSADLRVLAVDDDRAMVDLIGRIVARLGYRCETVESGEEAIERLSTDHFDLLITDVAMDGLSGLELLEAARRHDADLAVVVVSGMDDRRTAEAALSGGAFGYVVKPFEVTELQIAVSNALRRRELEIESRRHLRDLEMEVDRRTEQLRSATHEVKLQEQRFRTLAQASPLGILYADETGSFAYCNTNAEALLGRPGEDLVGHRWLEDLDSPGRHQLEASVRRAASGDSDAMCEYELLRPDGSTVWIRSRIAPALDDDDRNAGVVVLFEDIGDRKDLEHQLRHRASHDHLTGLPNRREFRTQLARRVMSLDATEMIGVLLVDLDQFKLVNDTYGHEAGDQLIVTVAERLVDCVPSDALVARLGGDEYVVAAVAERRDQLMTKAEAIRRALRQPVQVMGVELSLSASVGLGITGDRQTTVTSLLRSADIAMHEAKHHRDVVEVFDTSMAKDVARRLALTSELRRAVDHDLLTVHYQPIIDAATERLVGLEALARWTHDEWDDVSPGEFIPIAESMGLVHEIDRQMLVASARQLGRWQSSGRLPADAFISVNLSASQLSNTALPGLVREALNESSLDGSSLCVEVTEGALIGDMSRAVPILQELRALGARIAVDDFGTGRSALGYLGQLPLDVLKIDRSFVASIGSGGVDLAEVIIDLAHRFDLAVIAEGVEECHQLTRLRELGCDMVQGFLTGQPDDAAQAVPATKVSFAAICDPPARPEPRPPAELNEVPA
jgi:diguanylate cyclase (GGDEF)-like protein/PAS domain S-box-containing protein